MSNKAKSLVIIAIIAIITAIICLIPFFQGVTVQGTVTKDGTPLVNAEIYIDGEKNITVPPDGKYIIKNVNEGIHTLTIKKDGILVYKENISVKKETDNTMIHFAVISVTTASPLVTPHVSYTNSKIKIETPDPGYQIIPVRILNRSTYEALTFDPSKQDFATISYWLTKPAKIRIRVVHKYQKNLVLRTLLDWVPQKFGRNEVIWDGRDASGNIVNNVSLITFEGDSKLHGKHVNSKCHELMLKFTSPVKPGVTVSGRTKISAEIVGDRAYCNESGYKARLYVDYVLLREKSFGADADTIDFDWDTSTFNNGEYLITINVDDHHDHIGTVSVKVNILN